MQTVSTIPLAVPNIGPEDIASVHTAMTDGWVSSVGPDVPAFEQAVAAASGTSSAVAVASGTAALMIALRALGIGRGDLVLCPTYTFVATANAIHSAGADPIFVDIDLATWAIDINHAEQMVSRLVAVGLPKPRAIIVVYPMGNPIDMTDVKVFAERHGIRIVADAAAAIGSTFDGRPVGGLADATTFSFNGNKTMTTGGGGAIVGDDGFIAAARSLASTGRLGVNYDHDRPAFNERMTNIEAALGRSQIARLDSFIAAKARIRARHDLFAHKHDLDVFPRHRLAERGDWFSGVVLRPETDIRDVVSVLNSRGIGVRLFWKPMHLQEAYAPLLSSLKQAGLSTDDLYPVADALWRRVLPLPCSTNITDRQIDEVHAVLAYALAKTEGANDILLTRLAAIA
ncbi:DegT/DnrJ/EryC1/StrS family aminotransferase [Mesorhizobium shangrilense]|uniref:DegT/DnrJ/EryC1/StrS family aminotransferase n=1 Tax=Mesorhizobium shangrilense TaxID=460060 RepID=A0ABV2DQ87_9HYPH